MATATLANMAFLVDDIKTNHITSHTAMLHGTEDMQPIEVWHKHLGHLGQDNLIKLTKLSTGMAIGESHPLTITNGCLACLQRAQHRTISRIPITRSTMKLERIHTDICGPLLDKDIYGFKYFITFTDEVTRYTWTYPLVEKSDAFNAFLVFQAQVERQSGLKIKGVYADNGSEYISNQFRAYLHDNGMILYTSQPYSPEMNSIQERLNRTLVEKASAMLWTAKLLVSFWSMGLGAATYVKNRSPTIVLPVTLY